MTDIRILERQILILAVKNADLRMALEEIDAVAVSKRAGAAKKMQSIARKALFPTQKHKSGCPSGDFGPCDCSRLPSEHLLGEK